MSKLSDIGSDRVLKPNQTNRIMKKRNITLCTAFAAAIAFASAAQAETIISGETGTARSDLYGHESWGFAAARAVNDVGMTGEGATGEHQTSDHSTGWGVNQAGNIAHWFKVDLGDSYDVENMYVWNGLPGLPQRGAKTVDIYYSTTDTGNNTHGDLTDFNTTGWTFWGTVDDLALYVSGSYTPTDTIALNVNARYIVLNITAAHGGINNTSIAELQFSEASGTPPAAADLEMTEIDYAPDTGSLTLTWNSSPNETYGVYFSTDLIDWKIDLEGSFPADADADETTATFDLNDNFPEGIPEIAYFRVEKN